jgi:hypothetical protein
MFIPANWRNGIGNTVNSQKATMMAMR